MSAEQQRNLPVRLTEIVNVADQVLQFLRSLDTVEAGTAQDAGSALAVMDQMVSEAHALLLRATTDRNRLRRQIADTEQAERELTGHAGRAARRGLESADDDARAALRRAHRLRADLVAWEAELPEAEEVVRRAQDLSGVLAESRADLDRLVRTLERNYRAAETNAAMARIANWMQEIDRRVRVDLTGRVRETQAESEAQYTTALASDEMAVLRLRGENLADEIDNELEQLRRDDR